MAVCSEPRAPCPSVFPVKFVDKMLHIAKILKFISTVQVTPLTYQDTFYAFSTPPCIGVDKGGPGGTGYMVEQRRSFLVKKKDHCVSRDPTTTNVQHVYLCILTNGT